MGRWIVEGVGGSSKGTGEGRRKLTAPENTNGHSGPDVETQQTAAEGEPKPGAKPAPKPTRILLIRHGVNDYVKKGLLAGRTPGVSLNENGMAQAQALAERLGGEKIAAVYSSPLERCQETAAPLAQRLGVELRTLEDVKETDCGEWTG